MVIVAPRRLAVALFNQKRPIRQKSRDLRRPHGTDPCCSRDNPRSCCSGCSRSVRDTASRGLMRSQQPEHGYHRSHRTNTDKPIGVSMVIVAPRCVAVVLFTRKRPIRQKSRDLRRVHGVDPCCPRDNPRSCCSGCLRSVPDTTGRDKAGPRTAGTRIPPITPNQHG